MKRLTCIFGRHRWTTHGEEYNVCSRCGKALDGLCSPPKGPLGKSTADRACELVTVRHRVYAGHDGRP
jgi:hypothetical protein